MVQFILPPIMLSPVSPGQPQAHSGPGVAHRKLCFPPPLPELFPEGCTGVSFQETGSAFLSVGFRGSTFGLWMRLLEQSLAFGESRAEPATKERPAGGIPFLA